MKMKIRARRDSVCMGDDCFAPNEEILTANSDMLLSQWLPTVEKYVPCMHNVVWTVESGNTVTAFLVCDDAGVYTSELAVPDGKMAQLGIREIYCRHFHKGSFCYRTADGAEFNKYPECPTLLEKVRRQLSEERTKGAII